jgi:hypothetical protein
MGKSYEDRIEEAVRQRLTNAAAAAGVDRGRIELEIVWMLPPEFIRMYRDLFSRALADPVSPQSDGGKDKGRIRASGKPGDAMKARSMGGAAGGKRFVKGAWPIRDERALEMKNRLDRKILAALRETLDTLVLSEGMRASSSGSGSVLIRCGDCGRFLKTDWARCPYHGPA